MEEKLAYFDSNVKVLFIIPKLKFPTEIFLIHGVKKIIVQITDSGNYIVLTKM